jgi:hypothetical protein
VVSNSVLVKKFAWFTRSDGIARISRNVAISTIASTIVHPAAAATDLNIRSPRCTARGLIAVRAGFVPGGLTRSPSATTNSGHEMALTAADNLEPNASGMGMYPLSAKPFWPALMVLCRNAFTAEPTWESGYFEHTISYVANTMG